MACNNSICQVFNCDTAITAPGIIGDEIILVNFADIDKSTSTFNVAGELTLIGLKAGTEMYTWQAGSDSVKINNVGSPSSNVPGKFLHTVSFAGYGNTWAKKKGGYDAFVKGRYVAIVRDKDSNIHVFGYGAGMRGDLAWDAISNDGVWAINLMTRDPEFETSSPLNFVGSGAVSLSTAWSQLVALSPCA